MSDAERAIDEFLTRIREYHRVRAESDQAFLAAQTARHKIFQVMNLTVGPPIHDAKVDREISKRGTLMAKEAEARGAVNEMDLIDLIEGGSVSDAYDRDCTTCGHKINDHEANECWKTVDGKQCECGWMGVPNE